MFDILLISHGPVASAMKKSLGMFYSDLENIYYIGINEDGIEKFRKELGKLFDEKIAKDNVLVFTDLLFGTPFNEAAKYVSKYSNNFEILAGMNMPALIETVNLRSQGKSILEVVPKAIEAGKIISYTQRLNEIQSDDDE